MTASYTFVPYPLPASPPCEVPASSVPPPKSHATKALIEGTSHTLCAGLYLNTSRSPTTAVYTAGWEGIEDQ